ncbi:hypothetical protein PFMC_02057 [Plasmodium falciparum CAMP/Malaysia]|uniref:RRM domain-containing protein n=1 Tax=Plasmodium falciparum (isolate Camp / Malaysia) TaxID=5835 RepID=A0A024XA58_PLAFC|nr:hypothetical protein PFMC_02057 [Plasmodium falciparum CAMP/Malaysia]
MIQTEKKWADIDVDDDESINDNEIKKKWEDIDADDDLEANKKLSYFTNYENGIKVVTKYSENLKKQTVKVTKKIQEVVIKKKLNKEINNRLNLKNFNIDIDTQNKECTVRVTNLSEDVNVIIIKKKNNKYKYINIYIYIYIYVYYQNVYVIINIFYYIYVFHHIKMFFFFFEIQENELSNLFGKVGNIVRMFLAKHKETQNSKGFAFITYSKREEAKRAIEKLNRHGFENLLLSVI